MVLRSTWATQEVPGKPWAAESVSVSKHKQNNKKVTVRFMGRVEESKRTSLEPGQMGEECHEENTRCE
jgi:hypothetical protein